MKREGLELPSGEMMKEIDESGYKYLGVLQTDEVMDKKMKRRVRVEYLRRVRLLAKSKLNAGNLVQGINAWAVYQEINQEINEVGGRFFFVFFLI